MARTVGTLGHNNPAWWKKMKPKANKIFWSPWGKMYIGSTWNNVSLLLQGLNPRIDPTPWSIPCPPVERGAAHNLSTLLPLVRTLEGLPEPLNIAV